jgi:molybdopterin/thiamine biosynthesis adenylyltransferase
VLPQTPLPELSPDELARYARQIGPGVLSLEGQRRLKASSALVTRAGGMGGPAAMALVMAGVGRVVIAHSGDLLSADLNRQVLGSEEGIGLPRGSHFAARLRSMNRFVTVEALDREPDEAEALDLAHRVDVVLACPPNFQERMRLNRACVAAGTPLVDAAQWGLAGTVAAVKPGESACLACICPQEPPWEEHFPVLGAISAALGALAALEAIKILAGTGRPLFGRMWVLDAHAGHASLVDLSRRSDCPVCSS